MRIDVLTTFPEMFAEEAPGAMGVSIPGRARRAGLLELNTTNIRDFADNKHDKTDDRPFGGGPGMVMMCQPVWDAVIYAEGLDARPARRILMTPQGRRLDQPLVEELSKAPRLLIIAGHYEGVDERVIERLDPLEVSVGDYVLSGGELGAMVLIDAVTRLIPGVLGDDDSAGQDSFGPAPVTDPDGVRLEPAMIRKWAEELGLTLNASGAFEERLLDCPHYTRPRVWDGVAVPEVLTGGDHRAVARWRLEQMVARTRARRPDLLDGTQAKGA